MRYWQAILSVYYQICRYYALGFYQVQPRLINEKAIISGIPTEVLEGKTSDVFDKKPIRKYFDLCSEEFYLYQHKMIPSKVWGYWKEGMIITMRNQCFYETWKDLSIQKDYNKEFRNFMNIVVEVSLSDDEDKDII